MKTPPAAKPVVLEKTAEKRVVLKRES